MKQLLASANWDLPRKGLGDVMIALMILLAIYWFVALGLLFFEWYFVWKLVGLYAFCCLLLSFRYLVDDPYIFMWFGLVQFSDLFWCGERGTLPWGIEVWNLPLLELGDMWSVNWILIGSLVWTTFCMGYTSLLLINPSGWVVFVWKLVGLYAFCCLLLLAFRYLVDDQ